MDQCANSAAVFDKLADRYREKYMDLTLYDTTYREFCDLLPPGGARVLDAACGPGNVSRYLLSQRPEVDLLGIDLAPRMIELAREAVPSGRFAVHDCRNLATLNQRFDGILCAFGLPYLSPTEAEAFIQAVADVLAAQGVLYLSTLLGKREDSGFERCSSGDQVFINYYSEEQVIRSLAGSGFRVVRQHRLPSPSAAPKQTSDLIVIARKDSSATKGLDSQKMLKTDQVSLRTQDDLARATGEIRVQPAA